MQEKMQSTLTVRKFASYSNALDIVVRASVARRKAINGETVGKRRKVYFI